MNKYLFRVMVILDMEGALPVIHSFDCFGVDAATLEARFKEMFEDLHNVLSPCAYGYDVTVSVLQLSHQKSN